MGCSIREEVAKLVAACDAIIAQGDAASPAPWTDCQARDGECMCGQVWSIPQDMPVFHTLKKFEDTWPAIRYVKDERPSTKEEEGSEPEAFINSLEYGEFTDEQFHANHKYMAAVRSFSSPAAVALKQTLLLSVFMLESMSLEGMDTDEAEKQLKQLINEFTRTTNIGTESETGGGDGNEASSGAILSGLPTNS